MAACMASKYVELGYPSLPNYSLCSAKVSSSRWQKQICVDGTGLLARACTGVVLVPSSIPIADSLLRIARHFFLFLPPYITQLQNWKPPPRGLSMLPLSVFSSLVGGDRAEDDQAQSMENLISALQMNKTTEEGVRKRISQIGI